MASRFVELAGEHGLLSVLEGVVRDDDRETAILEAAAELSSTGPSLYKCEVPLQGRGDLSAVEDGGWTGAAGSGSTTGAGSGVLLAVVSRLPPHAMAKLELKSATAIQWVLMMCIL